MYYHGIGVFSIFCKLARNIRGLWWFIMQYFPDYDLGSTVHRNYFNAILLTTDILPMETEHCRMATWIQIRQTITIFAVTNKAGWRHLFCHSRTPPKKIKKFSHPFYHNYWQFKPQVPVALYVMYYLYGELLLTIRSSHNRRPIPMSVAMPRG